MIVVIGATGVIGRALLARLNAERLPCLGLSRDLFARVESVSMVSAVPRKPTAVIHLAAVVPQPPVIPDDDYNAALTRVIDERVLEAVRHWGCHVVYASGCSLYKKDGIAMKLEERVCTDAVQVSPYLATKQQGERDFLASGNATVLRISAPIGEGLPPSTVVGRFMEAGKAGRKIEVWGSGKREQNYVDVVDLADAFFRTLLMRPSELINIAADRPLTMLELAQEIIQVCGRGSIYMTGKFDPRDGETARYSNQRAADLLGWRPKMSMRTSLERLIRNVP